MRGIYERPWNTEDMIFNLTQRKLRRLSEAAGGDRLKALTPSRREEIADALFNQAYSAMMAVGIFSWGSHMQTLHEALQDNPLIAFEVWAACRVRWQEQLKAPTETVLQILDNKPSPRSSGGDGGQAGRGGIIGKPQYKGGCFSSYVGDRSSSCTCGKGAEADSPPDGGYHYACQGRKSTGMPAKTKTW